jgi:heme o synthase
MPSFEIIKSYYYLTKPGIIYSNAMTALAGYLLGAKRHIHIEVLLALIFGTSSLIASGCVFNNFVDRDIDSKMQRTKKRALVNGKITPKNALIFAIILEILGFIILSRTNLLTFLIGTVAIFSYVIIYGIAKRKTVHGTLVGTVPGAASLVAGYTAAGNNLGVAALLLFLIMLTWQMAHFYAIAIFRLDDYKAAGVPVMPAVHGVWTTKLQIMAYVLAFVLLCGLLSVTGNAGVVFFVIVVLAGLLWLGKGLRTFNTNDSKWARRMFGFSLITLLVFSASLAATAWLP